MPSSKFVHIHAIELNPTRTHQFELVHVASDGTCTECTILCHAKETLRNPTQLPQMVFTNIQKETIHPNTSIYAYIKIKFETVT